MLAERNKISPHIVTGGLKMGKRLLEAAKRKQVSIISSPHDTATTAALCRAAVAVRNVLNEEFICFREHAPLASVRGEATSSGHQIFPVLDSNGEVSGILSNHESPIIMNEPNPETAPVESSGLPPYKDRSAGLMVFGILTILCENTSQKQSGIGIIRMRLKSLP